MGCFSGCARILLIVFNFIFWLSGAAIMGVGIWILVDPDLEEYQDVIKDATSDEEFLKIAAYILIGFGAFVFLVGFCGCCGAIRSNKILLGLYIFFLVIVFAGELAAGIYVAVYTSDIEDKLVTGLRDSIRNNYKNGTVIMSAWDDIQKELECCGGTSITDYDNSTWQQAQTDPNIKIPASCCVLDSKDNAVNLGNCQRATSDYFKQDCKSALIDWVGEHSIVLIGVGCGIAALQIIGLVCAICFCQHIDKYNSN